MIASLPLKNNGEALLSAAKKNKLLTNNNSNET